MHVNVGIIVSASEVNLSFDESKSQMAISLDNSLLTSHHHLRLTHHLRLHHSLRLDSYPRLPCGDISYPALYEVRSKVNSPSFLAIVSDHNPFLPATRQTHPLDWEFDMAKDGLLVAFLISHLDARHLSTVLDLDIEEVRFVPSWITPSAPSDR